MYEGRIRHLEQMHAALDKQIDGIEKTGVFDDTQLHTLKKQRLQIRDQLAELKAKQQAHNQETKDHE